MDRKTFFYLTIDNHIRLYAGLRAQALRFPLFPFPFLLEPLSFYFKDCYFRTVEEADGDVCRADTAIHVHLRLACVEEAVHKR